MSDVPKIFDRDLLVSRRDRLSPESAPTFLLELVADDLLDRLAFVQRRFTRILVVGAYHGAVGRRLAAVDPRPEIIVELEGSSRLLAACQGLRVSAREDALPFAAASFDLVVSPLALQFVDDLPGALAQIRRVLSPDGLFLGVIAG